MGFNSAFKGLKTGTQTLPFGSVVVAYGLPVLTERKRKIDVLIIDNGHMSVKWQQNGTRRVRFRRWWRAWDTTSFVPYHSFDCWQTSTNFSGRKDWGVGDTSQSLHVLQQWYDIAIALSRRRDKSRQPPGLFTKCRNGFIYNKMN